MVHLYEMSFSPFMNRDLKALSNEDLQQYIAQLHQQSEQQSEQFESDIDKAEQEYEQRSKKKVLDAFSSLEHFTAFEKEELIRLLLNSIDEPSIEFWFKPEDLNRAFEKQSESDS